jgi:hypothetical protein
MAEEAQRHICSSLKASEVLLGYLKAECSQVEQCQLDSIVKELEQELPERGDAFFVKVLFERSVHVLGGERVEICRAQMALDKEKQQCQRQLSSFIQMLKETATTAELPLVGSIISDVKKERAAARGVEFDAPTKIRERAEVVLGMERCRRCWAGSHSLERTTGSTSSNGDELHRASSPKQMTDGGKVCPFLETNERVDAAYEEGGDGGDIEHQESVQELLVCHEESAARSSSSSSCASVGVGSDERGEECDEIDIAHEEVGVGNVSAQMEHQEANDDEEEEEEEEEEERASEEVKVQSMASGGEALSERVPCVPAISSDQSSRSESGQKRRRRAAAKTTLAEEEEHHFALLTDECAVLAGSVTGCYRLPFLFLLSLALL